MLLLRLTAEYDDKSCALRKGGVDLQVGFDVFTNSLFDGKVHKAYGGRSSRPLQPAWDDDLALKDLRRHRRFEAGTRPPMPAASWSIFCPSRRLHTGWAELDWSALGLLAESDADCRQQQEKPRSRRR
ncbi:MAG: hypothetical protein R3D52_01565 [Xanthobacteraceae bacterium]